MPGTGCNSRKPARWNWGTKEQEAAAWVLEHRQPAGKFTSNLPAIDTLFMPLESSNSVLGVIGLRLSQPTAPPTIHQRNLLDALTRQIALALDRQRLGEISEKARLLAESERLGKTLLDSMSHEIRTPVAAIRAAANDLVELKNVHGPGLALVGEIQEAAERLNRLVGKVLDMTRLESGYLKPQFNECEVNDIVNLAVAETEKDLARHTLTVELSSGPADHPRRFCFRPTGADESLIQRRLSHARRHCGKVAGLEKQAQIPLPRRLGQWPRD